MKMRVNNFSRPKGAIQLPTSVRSAVPALPSSQTKNSQVTIFFSGDPVRWRGRLSNAELPGLLDELNGVRRQIIWLRFGRGLVERRPCLGVDVMRRACGAASGDAG